MAYGDRAEGSIWYYAPNKGAPVFFAAAFAASAIWHARQAALTWLTCNGRYISRHYKSWRLTGLYVVCGFVYAIGFAIREVGAVRYDDLVIYIVSVCLCFAAPPLYELANYYTLGRILYYVPYYSPIHPGRVLTTFAALSMIIETLNGTGSSYVANQSLTSDQQQLGRTLLRVTLVMQLVVIGLFLSLATYFWTRCRRHGVRSAKLDQALLTLYMSNALILTRSIYRTVEFSEASYGQDWDAPDFRPSPIVRYEALFYVFEASLMLCNSVLVNMRHPRRFLPRSTAPETPYCTKIYLSKDGVSEVEGPGYKEERNFFATLVDPFDIYGMIKGRDNTTRFWDDDENGGGGNGGITKERTGNVAV
ncbi:hypothetical protein SLS62_011281 [Diatrype stigma]|uniref:RTA1 domain protein n=1 Tax=Diatrype stigma TaxID=117547 RepID=A0AAN9U6S2_9PEZI